MLLLRRVHGLSMSPLLKPGQIIVVRKGFRDVKHGEVVMIRHEGREKVKRVAKVAESAVYLLGDNSAASTDSRQFGWVDKQCITGKVVWPRI